MGFFQTKKLERFRQRYDELDKEIKDLSKIINQLRTSHNFSSSASEKIDLERNIESKEIRLKECTSELESLEEEIKSLEKETIREQDDQDLINEDREFPEFNQQPQQKDSESKKEVFNSESKVIQQLQKKGGQKNKPLENQEQDIHAESLLTDDEIKNTVLYTVTFFPDLSPEDFDQVVAFLLEGKTKEFTSSSEVLNAKGKVKTVTTKETKNLPDLWINPDNPTYKDKLLSQCYIEPQQLPNSFQQIIDFQENYTYLRDEFIQFFKKSAFYSKDKFQKIQILIFWSSEKIVSNAIIMASSMALSNPNLYGESFLLSIINRLGEYENKVLLDATLSSLASEQSLEQTIFNIQSQKRESENVKALLCERLAALVYKMEEYPELKGISDNFLKRIMEPPIKRPDVVLEICKYLRIVPDFNEIYWIKQILSRGDAETRNNAYNFLFSLLKQSKNRLYERLKNIEEWLPDASKNPSDYSPLNEYALQIFIEYSMEQTSNLKVEYYGQYPSRHSLFYPLQYDQDDQIDEKLNILVNFLFCLYLDKNEKYHSDKLALAYIIDRDVNAIDLIGFLIAQWYITLHGLQENEINPEASKIFQKLLAKIIHKINPYLRNELVKSWVRFGKYLLNEGQKDRKLKQEFVTRYKLVKKLKDQFTHLAQSTN
jgi:hypothetical protein